MVRVEVTTVGAQLRSISSSGHAIKPGDGESAPCAAISLLLKSLGTVLAVRDDCRVTVRAKAPGEFLMELDGCSAEEWLTGIWSLADRNLREIARAWPNDVSLKYNEE